MEQTSKIAKEFSKITSLNLGGMYAKTYEVIEREVKDVKVSSLKGRITDRESESLKRNMEVKSCYKNAWYILSDLAAMLNKAKAEVKVVYGYKLVCGLPIEHAFCRIDGEYFDPTCELLLNDNVENEEYATLREYDFKYVHKRYSERMEAYNIALAEIANEVTNK